MTTTQTTKTVAPSAPNQQAQPGLLGSMAPIILMMLVFYLLIMRPQQKKEAKRRALVNSVKKGDKILTASGIIGVLHKIVNDKEVSLEISENVRIRVLKSAITDVLGKNSELGKDERDASEIPASTTKRNNNEK
jgi:preprotein translocase subunit YajC